MDIRVPNVPSYSCKQSQWEAVPKLPTRLIMVAPSGSGKTVLLVNLCLRAYRGCFERIFIFSPTINVDRTWEPVKSYQRDTMRVSDREQTYWPDFDEGALQGILDRQMRITEIQKERGQKRLYSVLIILDDVADRPDITRGSHAIQELFVRMRHAMVSCFVSVQKFRVLSPLIRVNATDLIIFRIRSLQDLDAIAEETSALTHGKRSFYTLYQEATKDPFSFLYIRLVSPDLTHMFWVRFEKQLALP